MISANCITSSTRKSSSCEMKLGSKDEIKKEDALKSESGAKGGNNPLDCDWRSTQVTHFFAISLIYQHLRGDVAWIPSV